MLNDFRAIRLFGYRRHILTVAKDRRRFAAWTNLRLNDAAVSGGLRRFVLWRTVEM
jgi:hypothetical protein